MEIDNERWTRVVAKLIVDTRQRSIRWRLISDTHRGSENSLSSVIGRQRKVYLAEFNEQAFHFEVLHPSPWATVKDSGITYKLGIANQEGIVLRPIPITSGLADLAQAIEDQLSQVDEFVTRFLND